MKQLMVLFLLTSASAFANMVTNGTFTSNCSGWALTNADGFNCSTTGGNPGGRLILNSGPGVVISASQAISGLVINTAYRISFDASSHYNCCNSNVTKGAGVGIDGKQFDFFVYNGQPWTNYFFDFTYAGGSNVLVLSSQRNGTDSDAQFDNVSLAPLQAPVPEPGTWFLLTSGAFALFISGRRPKTQADGV